MPLERPAGPTVRKPITPALSSRFRDTRTPIAPRLAHSATVSPTVSARKKYGLAPTVHTSDPVATPPPDNPTPRSEAWLVNTGTDSPDTPSLLRHASTTGSVFSGSVVGSVAAGTISPRPITTPNAIPGRIARRISGSSAVAIQEEDASKFFYAGDIRSTTPSSKMNAAVSRVTTIPTARVRDATSSQGTTSPEAGGKREISPKDERFFRAGDLSSSQTPRARPIMAKQSSSTSASSLRTKSPAVTRQNSALSPRMSPQRPTKQGSSRPGSPVKNLITTSAMVVSPASPAERRNSIGSSSTISRQGPARGHKKAASVTMVTRPNDITFPAHTHLPGIDTASRDALSTGIQQIFPPVLASPDTISPRSASLNSSKTVETSVTNDSEISDIARIIMAVKESQNETGKDTTNTVQKPTQTPLSQAQLDAANARRERKVLDLEISNSSLLAINKTLERELRKQSAEIRRFRRLSRNGRLSFAPTNRSVSAQSMLSALSEQADEDEHEFDSSELEDEESELSDSDEENLSDTDSITARSRRRAREERRLMLDLSKHQQLLIDSQKLSQSIRKCVNLTEDLIKDGKRALEYKVGIGDVKLGGRVLTGDEAASDDTHRSQIPEEQPRMGLLSPSLTQTELHEASMWLGATQSLDGQDAPSQPDPIIPLQSFENLKIVQDEPG